MKPMMLHPESYNGTYKPVGGHLSLDFANTVSYRGTSRSHDWLSRFSNFSLWAKSLGLIDANRETDINNWANHNPSEAAKRLDEIKNQRERLYRILRKIYIGEKCCSQDLQAFNKDLSLAFQQQELVQSENGLSWNWQSGIPAVELVRLKITQAAFELLTSANMLNTLKTCEGCDWMFLDRSRAKRRRWCTMEDCGNRAKAKRFYHQKIRKTNL